MTGHMLCLSSGGGLPIFSRKKGNVDSLPFSLIGSLNGVHMFAKSHKLELLNTLTQDNGVAWKEFQDSIILICIARGATIPVLNRLIDSVFNAMVMCVGLDGVKSQRNIERLKRELKMCYPVIDRLLDSLDGSDNNNPHSTELTSMVQTLLCQENHLIQIVLNSYTECVDSMFSCVLIHGKVATATENWWSLHGEERKLLSLLATVENTTASKDIPVFLPYKSPNVAFRFVAIPLIPNVQVCSLCGPTPILEDIEQSAIQCFKNSMDILRNAEQCHPKNYPESLQLDQSVLGILLINLEYQKYMISRNTQQMSNKRSSLSGSHRLGILRTFYYQAVLTFLITDDDNNEDEENDNVVNITNNTTDNKIASRGNETYWCSEYHKCHALKVDNNILCILYNSTVPTYAMRTITQKTLKSLVNDKQLCW